MIKKFTIDVLDIFADFNLVIACICLAGFVGWAAGMVFAMLTRRIKKQLIGPELTVLSISGLTLAAACNFLGGEHATAIVLAISIGGAVGVVSEKVHEHIAKQRSPKVTPQTRIYFYE